MAKPQQEAGQQRDGLVTRLAVPTLDAQHIHLHLPQCLALVKPVPDHDIEHMTVGTHFRTRKHELAKALDVLVDKASKVGYNDHALQPDSKDAVKLNPSSRAVPSSKMKGTSIPDLDAKEKAIPNGWPDE